MLQLLHNIYIYSDIDISEIRKKKDLMNIKIYKLYQLISFCVTHYCVCIIIFYLSDVYNIYTDINLSLVYQVYLYVYSYGFKNMSLPDISQSH